MILYYIRKFCLAVSLILGVGLFCICIIKCWRIENVKFLGSEFLLTYVGLFFGFAFSILTYDYGVADKVREFVAKSNKYTVAERAETEARLTRLINELSENLLFVFFSFSIVCVVMVLEVVDIPDIVIDPKIWYSKINILNATKFSIFLLNLYGIFDLLVSTFNINSNLETMRRRDAESV